MAINDKTVEFYFDKNISVVMFKLDELTINGTVHPNKSTTVTKNNMTLIDLVMWGLDIFLEEVDRQNPCVSSWGKLEILKEMFRNYDEKDAENGKGCLDFKKSLGKNP